MSDVPPETFFCQWGSFLFYITVPRNKLPVSSHSIWLIELFVPNYVPNKSSINLINQMGEYLLKIFVLKTKKKTVSNSKIKASRLNTHLITKFISQNWFIYIWKKYRTSNNFENNFFANIQLLAIFFPGQKSTNWTFTIFNSRHTII